MKKIDWSDMKFPPINLYSLPMKTKGYIMKEMTEVQRKRYVDGWNDSLSEQGIDLNEMDEFYLLGMAEVESYSLNNDMTFYEMNEQGLLL